MKIKYDELKSIFKAILSRHGFTEARADLCASIFADSSLDGFHSHGVHRFPEFIGLVKKGFIKVEAEPRQLLAMGNFERWDAQLGPGPLAAWFCMERAIALAKKYVVGCVALQNNNHWMRGGTYGWQAAEAGCIGICFTNTKPNMPPWGAKEPRTGNNPLIIAVPQQGGHVVLDMAMSLFSFGKMKEYKMRGEELPFPGGFDNDGELSTQPAEIIENELTMPIGYWKGAGLSVMIDLMATLLSGGKTTAEIGQEPVEYALSQAFIAIDAQQINPDSWHSQAVQLIKDYISQAPTFKEGKSAFYPGQQTIERRRKCMEEGIAVNDGVWEKIMGL